MVKYGKIKEKTSPLRHKTLFFGDKMGKPESFSDKKKARKRTDCAALRAF